MTVQQAVNLLRATKRANNAGTLENVEAVRNSLKTSLSDMSSEELGKVAWKVFEIYPSRHKSITVHYLVSWATADPTIYPRAVCGHK